MATVKITDLPYITSLQSNTANTILLGVDIPGDYTGQLTLTTLANGLYSNNNLKVGNNDIIYANAVGQFTGNSAEYLQVALRNQDGDGSGDFVITADDGTDGTHFLDIGLNGSTYSDPDYSAMEAHDGYMYVQTDATEGNLVLGTVSTSGRINFIVGGTESSNIVTYISSSGIYSPAINSLVAANVATLRGEITANATSANSVINTRITANVATLRSEITANADSANSVINTRITANVATLRGEITANADSANSVINSRITANIATANLFTQAAFDKANNALANTSGTFSGSLTITNNLTTNGTVKISNSSFSATQAALTISSSNTGATQTPIADGYIIHSTGKHNTPTRIVSDSFGANGQLVYPAYIGRAARGNVTNPSAVQTDDILARFAGSSYGTTSYQVGGTARIDIVASENHTDSSRGTQIRFYNVANGSTIITNIATFNANDAVFTGSVNPQKGFHYTPNVLSTLTSFTIDFNRDSLIKFNVTADASITLSNYVYGKIVEVWITNSAAQNKVITHGCLANNSTSKATTFTIQAQSCAFLKYFSIDGDQSNVFVSITAY